MSRELMQQNIQKAQLEIDAKKDIVKNGKMFVLQKIRVSFLRN